jgi:hypothetical protein
MNLSGINWSLVLSAAIGAFFSHSLTIRLGPVDITATTAAGTPTHLTFSMILTAGLAALSGQTGVIQVGNVSVTITPHTAPIPAPPAIATLIGAVQAASQPTTGTGTTVPPKAPVASV